MKIRVSVLLMCVLLSLPGMSAAQEPITPENADQLAVVGYLGRGALAGIAIAGDKVALATGVGVWIYEAGDLAAPPKLLTGEEYGYDQVALSPDGSQVAAAGTFVLWVWDTASGEPLYQVAENVGNDALHYSPDGSLILMVDENLELGATVINAADGSLISIYNTANDALKDGVWSPDGTQAAIAGNDGRIHLIDPLTGEETGVIGERGSNPLLAVAWSPDGALIAAGDWAGTVYVWQVETGAMIATLQGIHEREIEDLEFSADSQVLISAENSTRTVFWDVASWEPIHTLESDTLLTYDLDLDGERLISIGTEVGMRLWDVTSGNLLTEEYIGTNSAVSTLSISADSRTLILSAGFSDPWRYDLATLHPDPLPMPVYNGANEGSALSADGRWLATQRYDGTVNVWDVETGAEVYALAGFGEDDHPVGMAFSPDGTRLAVSAGDSTYQLLVWDLTSGEQIFAVPGYYASEMQFSADGNFLLASGNVFGQVVAWDIAAQERIALLEGHTDYAYEVAFGADDTQVISGGSDGQLIAWDLATGEMIYTVEVGGEYGVGAMAVSPDRRLIAIAISGAAGDTMQIHDAATGELIASHTTQESYYDMLFSPDGTRIIGGGYGSVLYLWEVS